MGENMAGLSQGESAKDIYTVTAIGQSLREPAEARGENNTGNALKEAGVGIILGRIFSRATGPIGGLLEAGVDALRDNAKRNNEQENYLAGIKFLAENNISGFVFHETTIGDEKIQIAVDATQLVNYPDAKPWVWTSGNSLEIPAVAASINKATASIAEFKLATEVEFPDRIAAYTKELEEYKARISSARTFEDLKSVSTVPPMLTVLPPDVLSAKIQNEYKTVLEKLYTPIPEPQNHAPLETAQARLTQ